MAEINEKNKLAHPSFLQPGDTSAKVWKYMDLAKLIWALSNNKLYLRRVDLLNDPHEGSIPKLLAKLRDEFLTQQGVPAQFLAQQQEIGRSNRSSCYVSCWRMGNSESEAMWRLYCPNGYGVAFQTTYQKLVDSIAHESALYIGCVRYIDYEREGFHLDNIFNSIMHKRVSFSHENEVRLVKTLPDYWGLPVRVGSPGITVDWSVDNTAERLFVDPYAGHWFLDVVTTVVGTYAPKLVDKIQWSEMRGEPSY